MPFFLVIVVAAGLGLCLRGLRRRDISVETDPLFHERWKPGCGLLISRTTTIAVLVVLFGLLPRAKAQEIEIPKVELYGGYDYVRDNANPRFNAILASTACIPGSQSDGQAGQETRRGVPVLRNADENAWLASLGYYSPQPGFDRLNRDIDVDNLRLARAWHFPQG